MTWADSSMLGLLNRSGIFIFLGFGILAFLKSVFPEIDNEYLLKEIFDLKYITIFCIFLALIIFKISKFPLKYFIINHSILTFIYVFGVVTICIRIFFNK